MPNMHGLEQSGGQKIPKNCLNDYISTEEIHKHALNLGIDLEQEPELLRLAKESLCAPLQPGWEACQDKDYYMNLYTDQFSQKHSSSKDNQQKVSVEREHSWHHLHRPTPTPTTSGPAFTTTEVSEHKKKVKKNLMVQKKDWEKAKKEKNVKRNKKEEKKTLQKNKEVKKKTDEEENERLREHLTSTTTPAELAYDPLFSRPPPYKVRADVMEILGSSVLALNKYEQGDASVVRPAVVEESKNEDHTKIDGQEILENYLDDDIPTKEEIYKHALNLGIDPEQESELLKLAKESLCAPLLPGWEACQDEDDYINLYMEEQSRGKVYQQNLHSTTYSTSSSAFSTKEVNKHKKKLNKSLQKLHSQEGGKAKKEKNEKRNTGEKILQRNVKKEDEKEESGKLREHLYNTTPPSEPAFALPLSRPASLKVHADAMEITDIPPLDKYEQSDASVVRQAAVGESKNDDSTEEVMPSELCAISSLQSNDGKNSESRACGNDCEKVPADVMKILDTSVPALEKCEKGDAPPLRSAVGEESMNESNTESKEEEPEDGEIQMNCVDSEDLRKEHEVALRELRSKLVEECKIEKKHLKRRHDTQFTSPRSQLYRPDRPGVMDEEQKEHEYKLEHLREEHRQQLESIREAHLKEESRQRERFSKILQQERQHLLTSHSTELNYLRLQLDSQLQDLRDTCIQKEAELKELLPQLEMKIKELKSQELCLQAQEEELKKKKQLLCQEEDKVEKGVCVLNLPHLQDERDFLQARQQRAREERNSEMEHVEREKEEKRMKKDMLHSRCDQFSQRTSTLEQKSSSNKMKNRKGKEKNRTNKREKKEGERQVEKEEPCQLSHGPEQLFYDEWERWTDSYSSYNQEDSTTQEESGVSTNTCDLLTEYNTTSLFSQQFKSSGDIIRDHKRLLKTVKHELSLSSLEPEHAQISWKPIKSFIANIKRRLITTFKKQKKY